MIAREVADRVRAMNVWKLSERASFVRSPTKSKRRKPHVASPICLRATIFQNPEWTLWTQYFCHTKIGLLQICCRVHACYIPSTPRHATDIQCTLCCHSEVRRLSCLCPEFAVGFPGKRTPSLRGIATEPETAAVVQSASAEKRFP
jgi:hypothetical protein